MDLVKKNIHYNRTSKKVKNQFTLEEDINLPDTKEDMECILYHNERILIEEVKAGEQKLHIRGKLLYAILYQSEETGRLCSMEGSILINEHLYMEDVQNTDKISVKAGIEDFSVGIINSRKISVQSIIELYACVQELYDEPISVAVENGECEVLQKECEFLQLAVCNKDIYRFRENISIPNNMPNVENVVWKNMWVQEFECKPLDGQLSLQGKIDVFIIYEGERENYNQMYQTSLPFNTMLDCPSSAMNMISDISYDVVDCQLHMDTDFDGEARTFSVEMVLEMDIKLYSQEKVNVLWDVYGIQKEVIPKIEDVNYDRICLNQGGMVKVNDTMTVPSMKDDGGKIMCGEGKAILEKYEVTNKGIILHGMLKCQVLWKGNEENVYGGTQSLIPFSYLVEAPEGVSLEEKDLMCNILLHCNFVQFVTEKEDAVEVKANVTYHILVFEKVSGQNIDSIDAKEMDMEKYNSLPSMAIYFAKPGDTLWEMGKKYCVPMAQIRELNNLTQNDIKPGEKVLIVRGSTA